VKAKSSSIFFCFILETNGNQLNRFVFCFILFHLLALDLQDCAISTNGAKEFLNAAKYNSLIHIIDIRNNPLVDRDVMEKLIEQLLINCEDDRLCEVGKQIESKIFIDFV